MIYPLQNIEVEISDQPGVMAPGYKLNLFSSSDPIPDGLAVTEVRTSGTHKLTTGQFKREHIVQKTAYNRYRLRLFAQPSDNISLISSASTLRIKLKSEVQHIAQVLEWNQSNPAGMSLRQIDLTYIDTNEENYGSLEPVNNWLTTEAIAAKISAGQLNQATTCRYNVQYTLPVSPVPLVVNQNYYSLLTPVFAISEPMYPEEDTVSGNHRPNVTQAHSVMLVTMYINEFTRRAFNTHAIIYGSRSGTVHRIYLDGVTYTAVQPPQIETEQVIEASDLFRIQMRFAYNNSYIHNY